MVHQLTKFHVQRVDMVINPPWNLPFLGAKGLTSPEQTATDGRDGVDDDGGAWCVATAAAVVDGGDGGGGEDSGGSIVCRLWWR
ncbi:hypothetical protein Tco_0071779 [Tanacetum coccineum]